MLASWRAVAAGRPQILSKCLRAAGSCVMIGDQPVTGSEGAAMGSEYQAQIDDLRAAAKAATSVSEQVSAIDLAGAIDEAGSGVPGAQCVTSFTRLGEAWREHVKNWRSLADRYATALTTAADTYTRNEDAAAEDFNTFRGLGRPV